MNLTVKGQVTIPKELRKRYGLKPRSAVVFKPTPEGILITPEKNEKKERFEMWAKKALGCIKGGMTTAQVMKLTRDSDIE